MTNSLILVPGVLYDGTVWAHQRLAIVEECGHMSTMERPEAVTRELQTWLTEVLRI